jgi:hypothetical protein
VNRGKSQDYFPGLAIHGGQTAEHEMKTEQKKDNSTEGRKRLRFCLSFPEERNRGVLPGSERLEGGRLLLVLGH